MLCTNVSSAVASSQFLTWFDTELRLRKRIDFKAQTLELEKSPGVWMIQAKVKFDSSILHQLPPRIAPHYFFQSDGKIRFTLAGTGQVYDFDASQNSLKRIDQTFYAGYNFGASVFQRRQVLYSFGGSGFWNYSKALTYYKESGREWENIKSVNLGPQAMFNGFQGYSDSTDLYYAGGSEHHDFLNEQATNVDSKLYVFDFNQHAWSLVGELNPQILQAKNREVVWSGRYFIQFSDHVIYLIDPIKNEVFEVKSAEVNFQAAPTMYVHRDNIYAFWDEEGGKRKIYSISEFKKLARPIGVFYEAPSQLALYLIISSAALGFSIVYYLYRLKKKPALDLDESELKLINALINAKEGLTTVEVNEILGISIKNIDNIRKLRLQIISNINHKFQVKYRLDYVIIRFPSAVDKRQSLYTLRPEAIKICKSIV